MSLHVSIPGLNTISSIFYALGQQPSVIFGFLWSSILEPGKKLSTNACSNIRNGKHNASYHSLLGLACDVRFDKIFGKYHYNHLFYQFFHHPSLSNTTLRISKFRMRSQISKSNPSSVLSSWIPLYSNPLSTARTVTWQVKNFGARTTMALTAPAKDQYEKGNRNLE